MNKKEFIDKLKKLLEAPSELEGSDFDIIYNYAIKRAIHLAEDLDEQQETIDKKEKPVVPQFVVDWLEVCKDNLALSLANSMNPIVLRTNNQPEKTIHWFKSAKNQETFAKAWLYSYEVEKEKLYTVEIPNPNSKGTNKIYLCKDDTTGKVYLCKGNFNPSKNRNLRLTESEIKEDFDWAWKFAKEVEE